MFFKKLREATIEDIVPICKYEEDCFVKNDGSTFDIVEINCKDLMSADNDTIEYDALTLMGLYRKYPGDLKIVGMNFPTDTKANKQYGIHKLNKTKNRVYKKFLNEKLQELDYIEKNRTDREYYIMFFSTSIEAHKNDLHSIYYTLSGANLATIMSKEKKMQVLFKLNNKSTSIFNVDYEPPTNNLKKKNDKQGKNLELLSFVQPQGGISFKDEKLVKTGDGYEACLHVYAYPKSVSQFWLTTLVNLNNMVTTIDIGTQDINEVRKNINRGMGEQKSRVRSTKSDVESMTAERRYNELKHLFDEIDALNEIVKLIHIRIFISGRTKQDTEEQIEKVFIHLENHGYKSAVFLNETQNEWSSLYRSYTEQNETYFKRDGQPVTSGTLAGGDPFHFSSLKDPYAFYMGCTSIEGGGGMVLWDMFAKTLNRQSYNTAVVGKMGSGKSTLLKKILLNRAIRGDYIRGFDVNGEYKPLIDMLGGKMISLDGSQGILNMLEIFKTSEKESISFSRHLSKLNTMYKFLAPYAEGYEVIEFEGICRELYSKWGLVADKDNENKITGLPADAYPTFSDLLKFIRARLDILIKDKSMDNELKKQKSSRCEKIELVISNLVSNYGYIFDGHTSIENLVDNQIVFFNISNLLQMKSEVFDVQFFNAFSLCWDNCIKVGLPMKKLYDANKIDWQDITRFCVFFDEAHHIINANKLYAVTQITTYERESRKYFGGLLYASQSIRDYVPEGSNSDSINAIKTLFELTQYKFIMTQDTNSVDTLKTIFRNELTNSELERIPRFETGQCILSMSGASNIEFNIDISDEEKNIFQGGA